MTLRTGKEIESGEKKIFDKDATPVDEGEKIQKKTPLPFPTRAVKTMNIEMDQELKDTFKKVKINIPLLDAIKQIPKHANFLKEL